MKKDTEESTTESRMLEVIPQVAKNIKRFAEHVGMTPETFYNLKAGGKFKLSGTTLEKIFTAYPQINSDYILFGRGSMLHPSAGFRQAGIPFGMAEKEEELPDDATVLKREVQHKQEIIQHKNEIIEAQSREIALLREMLAERKIH